MKYVILVGDGMGDYPVAELGGKTPLEAAATPHLDALAHRGELGCARTIPPGKEPGSNPWVWSRLWVSRWIQRRPICRW